MNISWSEEKECEGMQKHEARLKHKTYKYLNT